MQRIVFFYSVGFCGMDATEYAVFPDDITEKELEEAAWAGAVANAEMYGYYPIDDYASDSSDEDEEEDDWQSDKHVDSIEGHWERYDPNNIEHQGHIMNGTEEQEFQRLEDAYRG